MIEFFTSSDFTFILVIVFVILAIACYLGYLMAKYSGGYAWLSPWLILACGAFGFLAIQMLVISCSKLTESSAYISTLLTL